MACLERPLTVIAQQSCDEGDGSSPLLATWYDKCHEHFVAQIDERKARRVSTDDVLAGTDAAEEGPQDSGGEVVFQTLALPKRKLNSGDGESRMDATTAEDRHNSLVPSRPIRIMLPRQLTADVPILARFSLNMQLLALQFSPKLVRIVRIDKGEGKPHKQWTIDLSLDATPFLSDAHSLHKEKTRARPAKRFLQPRKASSFAGSTGGEDGLLPGTTILPGGVLWSNHGGNSEDLIVITTSAVLFYKVSTTRSHMAKSRAYPHPLAAGFWFEPRTRALMVGSFVRVVSSATDGTDENSVPASVMEMRTFFLRFPPVDTGMTSSSFSSQPEHATAFGGSGGKGAELMNTSYYSFPRLELPPPEMLKPFVIGERVEATTAEPRGRASAVTTDQIALVCIYGSAYCIELGSSGNGVGVNVFHLDKAKGTCTHAMQINHFQMSSDGSNVFVSVVDNVILVHSKESKMSLLIDVADADSVIELDNVDSESTEAPNAALLYESTLSFLSPAFLLDPNEQGLLYRISIDLSRLVRSVPRSNATLPFLLRRQDSPNQSHILALECMKNAISDNNGNGSMLSSWIEVIAETYEQNAKAAAWDHDACLSLITKSALLEKDGQSSGVTLSPRPPHYCDSVLTQTEIMENVLLPQAQHALWAGILQSLHFLCDVAIEFMGSLEKRNIMPCPALVCLVIALLWRLGEYAEVLAVLRARHEDWLVHARMVRQKELEEVEKGMLPEESDRFDVSQEVFAEMLIALVCSDADLSVGAGDGYVKDSARYEQFKSTVLTYATDLLCSISSYQVAAKHLLYFGRVMDAITVCSRAIAPPKMTVPQGSRVERSLPSPGTRAYDFFQGAAKNAEKMDDLGDKVRLFYHVHTFIREWDPDSLKTEVRQAPPRSDGSANMPSRQSSMDSGSIVHAARKSSFVSASSISCDDEDKNARGDVELSILAYKVGEFPDKLFGGESDPICSNVKKMFGFAS